MLSTIKGVKIMWKNGIIEIEGNKVEYFAKIFDEGSIFGINNGRISKLTLEINGKMVLNYDRGWDIKAKNSIARKALNKILEMYK